MLELRRPGFWYAVCKFFDAEGTFQHWCVDFERPVARRPDGIDIDDLELDLIVRAAAPEVVGRLDRDGRWWASWDEWLPTDLPVES